MSLSLPCLPLPNGGPPPEDADASSRAGDEQGLTPEAVISRRLDLAKRFLAGELSDAERRQVVNLNNLPPS